MTVEMKDGDCVLVVLVRYPDGQVGTAGVYPGGMVSVARRNVIGLMMQEVRETLDGIHAQAAGIALRELQAIEEFDLAATYCKGLGLGKTWSIEEGYFFTKAEG